MTPDRIAYLAGYFEARGSIVARASDLESRYVPGKILRRHAFEVTLSGPPSLIDAVAHAFGGAKQTRRHWRATSATAARFLATIFPHVRHRREEIEAGLDFYRSMRDRPYRGRAVPPEVEAERDRLAERVAALRGTRKDYGKRIRLGLELRGEVKESVA